MEHPRRGDALLVGILRCRRCGRKLTVRYTGNDHDILRYTGNHGWMNGGEPRCIAFGGLSGDAAIGEQVLQAVDPEAVEAALRMERQEAQRRDDVREAIKRKRATCPEGLLDVGCPGFHSPVKMDQQDAI
jgi:hypothetical protein